MTVAADKAVIFSFAKRLAKLKVESAFVWYNRLLYIGGE